MPMDSACGNAALPALGFPIRESADHRLFSAYPRLIAAVHALHRLLVPRHPPCALDILTVISIGVFRRPRKAGRATPQIPVVAQGDDGCPVIPVVVGNCAVFKVRGERPPAHAPRLTAAGRRPAAGLSKLNSMRPASRARGPPGPVDVTRSWPPSDIRHPAHAGEDGRLRAGTARLRRWVVQPL